MLIRFNNGFCVLHLVHLTIIVYSLTIRSNQRKVYNFLKTLHFIFRYGEYSVFWLPPLRLLQS